MDATSSIPEKKRKRRSHHKSRNGCLNCKRLRVKCDEVTPKCGNCTKRNRECEYLVIKDEPKRKGSFANSSAGSISTPTPTNSNPSSRKNSQATIISSPHLSHNHNDILSYHLPSTGGGGMRAYANSPESPPLSSSSTTTSPITGNGIMQSPLEQELLQHYCANFMDFIMVYGENDRRVWADYVPALVLNSPCIASGLLAVTALHLDAINGGSRNLTDYAFNKFTEALTQFKSVRTLSTTSSAEATFLTSVFVMMLSYCFYDNLPIIAANSHGMDLITVTRGPLVVARNLGPRLAESNVSQIVQPLHSSDPDPHSSSSFIDFLMETCDAMDRLGLLNPTVEMDLAPENMSKTDSLGGGTVPGTINGGMETLESPRTDDERPFYQLDGSGRRNSNVAIYRKAIEQLRNSIKYAAYNQCPPVLISWEMMLDAEFLQLARVGYPFAKVILIYHLVALHAIRNYFWIGDRPRRQLLQLVQQLGPKWQSFYAWPLTIIERPDYNVSSLWHYLTADAGPFDISMLW